MSSKPAADDQPNYNKPFKTTPQSRRQKKLRRKNRLKAIKKDKMASRIKERRERAKAHSTTFPVAPAIPALPNKQSVNNVSWTENYVNAATWQLKHQVAYWRAKATALQYENKILHDSIRSRAQNVERLAYSMEPTDSEEEVESEDDDFEVSEEFIQFLRNNQAYREDARRERERMRAINDVEQRRIQEMEAGPAPRLEEPQEVLKRLYGVGWEKISALETSLQSEFISICDREKPMYWPNVPFNFNFG